MQIALAAATLDFQRAGKMEGSGKTERERKKKFPRRQLRGERENRNYQAQYESEAGTQPGMKFNYKAGRWKSRSLQVWGLQSRSWQGVKKLTPCATDAKHTPPG